MPMWADPDAVEAQAANWSANQIECRLTRSHYWTRRMTLISRSRGGVMTVRQECGRHCGVARKAQMDADGHVGHWTIDYSSPEGKRYLMRDEGGKSIGRIDAEGNARLRRISWSGLAVYDEPDEDEDE